MRGIHDSYQGPDDPIEPAPKREALKVAAVFAAVFVARFAVGAPITITEDPTPTTIVVWSYGIQGMHDGPDGIDPLGHRSTAGNEVGEYGTGYKTQEPVGTRECTALEREDCTSKCIVVAAQKGKELSKVRCEVGILMWGVVTRRTCTCNDNQTDPGKFTIGR